MLRFPQLFLARPSASLCGGRRCAPCHRPEQAVDDHVSDSSAHPEYAVDSAGAERWAAGHQLAPVRPVASRWYAAAP